MKLDFSYLSDTNSELINTYRTIRDNVEHLIKILEHHQSEYRKSPTKYYYHLRGTIKENKVEKAARFIFLNKTCYNGLYRVNKSGLFNVPIGRYRNPLICDVDNLANVCRVLKRSKARIECEDYQETLLKNCQSGDFIYLDPPYNPVSNTANFTGYTNNGFGKKDQYNLAEVFKKLDNRNCKILLSNSDTPIIRELYKEYSLTELMANRAINSKASNRTGHTELLIRNWE
jgi:DNA adenine methylase